jgi:ABC-2 type transport system permease protein
MRALREIGWFEIRYQLRQPLFYVCLAIFSLLTFGAVVSEEVTLGSAIGNINRNAPYVIMQILLVMSILGFFPATAFLAGSIHRDVEHGTESLFFSAPITKGQYLGGRFLGAFFISIAVFFGVVLAIVLGSLMPWIPQERIGPFLVAPYLFSFFVLMVPNLLVAGSIFFSVAALTRSMLATYAALVGLFVGYAIASAFLGDLENELFASLLDPFGLASFNLGTKYWTVYDKNSQLLSLRGPFLYNRLLWLAVAGLVLVFTYARFRLQLSQQGRAARRNQALDLEAQRTPPLTSALPAPTQTFTAAGAFRQYLHSTRVELSGILKGLPFLVILALGIINVVLSSKPVDQLFGTPVLPVTHLMIKSIEGSFLLFALIIVTFYSGELIWKERSGKTNEVFDALPAPSWVFWASKLTALALLVVLLLASATLTTLALQTYRGYHRYELGLYLRGVFLVAGSQFLQMMVLAFFVQVLTPSKYLGFLVMLLYFASLAVLPGLHLEHHLYNYATTPPAPYSDMNGYGHFVAPLFWFHLYWSLFAAALGVGAHLLWVRGTEARLRERLRLARARAGRSTFAALGLSLGGFAAVGAFIFYNTNVENPYRTTDQIERRRAEQEKRFKQYERFPQPRIAEVRADVDIFPAERSVRIRGEYRLINRTGQPVADLHVSMNPDVKSFEVELPGAVATLDDRELGYRIYRLSSPLAPGDTLPLAFTVSYTGRGFVNGDANTAIVHNGTFFNSDDYFPHLGYLRSGELLDPNKRKKYGLPPVQRMAKVDDTAARMNYEGVPDADWIRLDTTISTSEDQTGIAPGYLQKEWIENGRRHFHYKTEAPILSFWSYLSARYAVKQDRWKDVAIEVYYHPDHPYNVDRMIDGVKKSLAYFTENFSPYQHRQVRILEFPRYQKFAQSFPNTIPFSEGIGFITALEDPEAIDYVFYITAHEVAHQWWAHQVIGGDVQGATVITETLAQYSALMVMEREYGKEKMKRFLEYELNRYLGGRGGELVAEMPLMLVENQPYIHYAKGSLVMYALRDYIGEDALNRVLAGYIKDKAYQPPPYTNTIELLDRLRAAMPEEQRSILHDMFETITLYDGRAIEATSTPLPGGKYQVKLVVEVKKLRADERGSPQETPVNDLMDVAVLGERSSGDKKKEEVALFLEKRRITEPRMTFEMTVDAPPLKAGVDPYHKLIDQNPDDNVMRVSPAAEAKAPP